MAGCLSGGGNDDPADGDGADSSDEPGDDPNGGPGDDSNGGDGDSGDTAPAGSCESLFGDTMERYDPGDRGMIATFSYPMGGDILFEQSDGGDHLTSVGYGQGEVSPLQDLTVSERGPLGSTGNATEAYAFNDEYENGTVSTYGGEERPAAIRRSDDESVTILFRVEEPDGFYEFSVQTAVGEGEPCPDTYESITRAVAESFEPIT
jgi:hypothetical protein